MLETERLILRRWNEGDAEDLYKYASEPDVGPIAGWPAHKSIEESLDVIKNVLNGKEAYAIFLKEEGKAIRKHVLPYILNAVRTMKSFTPLLCGI